MTWWVTPGFWLVFSGVDGLYIELGQWMKNAGSCGDLQGYDAGLHRFCLSLPGMPEEQIIIATPGKRDGYLFLPVAGLAAAGYA